MKHLERVLALAKDHASQKDRKIGQGAEGKFGPGSSFCRRSATLMNTGYHDASSGMVTIMKNPMFRARCPAGQKQCRLHTTKTSTTSIFISRYYISNYDIKSLEISIYSSQRPSCPLPSFSSHQLLQNSSFIQRNHEYSGK